MTPDRELELVLGHAPVLWLHRHEAFHPVDAQRMVDYADLYRRRKNAADVRVPTQPTTLAELARVSNSKNCYLKMPALDAIGFRIPDGVHGHPGYQGPSAMMRLARYRYGHRLYTEGVPVPGDPDQPKYYARVTDNVPIVRRPSDPGPPVYDYPTQAGHPHEGRYVRIEYHYFFAYNDAWNQHQGDWDSTVTLYLRKNGGEVTSDGYLVVFMHHERWACVLPESSGSICSWIRDWHRSDGSELNAAYVLDGHPYIFIAQGAHGGYPTPGHSLYGLHAKVPPFVDETVLFNVDEREFGAVCIAPPGLDSALIHQSVRDAQIDDDPLQIGRWQPPGLITEDPEWFRYEGLWGQPSPYSGWSGPDAKRLKKGTTPREFKLAIAHGYESGAIVKNWHGIGGCE